MCGRVAKNNRLANFLRYLAWKLLPLAFLFTQVYSFDRIEVLDALVACKHKQFQANSAAAMKATCFIHWWQSLPLLIIQSVRLHWVQLIAIGVPTSDDDVPAALLPINVLSFHRHSWAVLTACPSAGQDLHECHSWLHQMRVPLDCQVSPTHRV